jgi:sugar (pentulose or hexulose) kinase
VILTVDFGTSVTKVVLWPGEPGEGAPVVARAEVPTVHPEPGWAEQDPVSWWTSVVVACAQARAQAPDAFGAVEVISCSGARQTFVPVRASGESLGRALLWSDHRAADEAATLRRELDGHDAVTRLTGVHLDAGAVAAKLEWLAAHDPARLAGADWLLGPRDLMVWRMTGEVVTDASMASRSGLYARNGELVETLAGRVAPCLPPVVAPGSVVGVLRGVPAAELGLQPEIPVVVAGGDRACEVLGAGAAPDRPMVSWGTTANISAPVDEAAHVPPGLVVTRGAAGGWLLEGGLSAAGSLLAWLGRLAGDDPVMLAQRAAARPPGARGVTVVPWLDGARAPWWRDDARAAVLGLSSAHDAGDLARAVLEAVAFEVVRCLSAIREATGPAAALALAGAGSSIGTWVEVLTAVTGLPARTRQSGEAASAGAALLGAAAVGRPRTLDELDPPAREIEPDPEAARRYRELRPRVDRAAAAVLDWA